MPSLIRQDKPIQRYATFIGIDPGVNGGMAVTWPDGSTEAIAMPKNEQTVWDWFDTLAVASDCDHVGIFATIELVGGYVKREGGNPGSAMFTFGRSYGALRMALVAAGIPFEAVRPQAWQKALGLSRSKGMKPTAWKNLLKTRAQELFPDLNVTKSTSDALLLARHGKMKWGS